MKFRIFFLATIAASILASMPAAQADYPEATESRIRSQLSKVLSSSEHGVAFRACLLTEDELLVEVTVDSGPQVDPAATEQAVELTRAQVAQLIAKFPGLRLSELSSFRPKATQPPAQLFALKSER